MGQVFESSSRSVRDRRRVTVGRRTSSRVFPAFSEFFEGLSGPEEFREPARSVFEIESRLLVGQGLPIGCRGRLSPPIGPGSDIAEGR